MTARRYRIVNPGVLFAPDRRVDFTHAAPLGSVVLLRVDGRPVTVLLAGYPVGGRLAAELLVTYL
ncbi:hypothetical protein ACIQU7_23930 [Streptomyces albidoflavus]